MKKLSLLLGALIISISAFAEIELTAPLENAVVSRHSKLSRLFLNKSSKERNALMCDEKYRKPLECRYYPIKFAWNSDSKETFTLQISENPDFKNPIEIKTKKKYYRLQNLKMAQKYYWRVLCKNDISKTRTFTTEDLAPRVLKIDGIGNARDLGGRVGLNGKRIKQNLIIRSVAFNRPSKDGTTAGKDTIKPDGKKFLLNSIGIKTDLDLRSKKEVANMKNSPLGENVKWVNIPALCYAQTFTEKGKKNYAQLFCIFCDKNNYPISIHCQAGADRTGTLCYILNAVLGVSDDELEKDWQFTIFATNNMAFAPQRRYFPIVENIKKFGTEKESTATKAERFLKSAGITDAEILAFRKIMLEK
jgi:hypothetical protein